MGHDLACAACLRRTRLLAALGGHLDHRRYDRHRLTALLALPDHELLAAAGVRDAAVMRARCEAEDSPAIGPERARVCRHDHGYPAMLAGPAGGPAVLHLAGDRARIATLLDAPCVAVVGTRRASDYGVEVARALGRALSAAGLTVVSGMAHGIDSAAHAGALEAGGNTLAVLPGGCDRPYPPGRAALHHRILERGGALSELPFGHRPRRWCFIARNRIIAGLAELTVIVEAAERSGALVTAGLTQDLGREVAAVPGRVTSPSAAGTNALLKDGAALVRDGEDVLDLVFGAGGHRLRRLPDRLPPPLGELHDEISRGRDTLESLTADGRHVDDVLVGLAELELRGLVRAGLGGRYVACLAPGRRPRPPSNRLGV